MSKLNKILLFLLLSYIFKFHIFFNNILTLNVGFPEIQNLPWLFFFAPSAYILTNSVVKRSLKLPLLSIFVLVFSLFFLFESNFLRPVKFPEYSFIYNLTIIYMLFIVFSNLKNEEIAINFIITSSVIIVFAMSVIYLIGFMGFINMGIVRDAIALGPYGEERIRFEAIHPNGFSYTCYVAIILLFISKLRSKNSNKLLNKNFIPLFLIFLSIILINTTRGVFLMVALSGIVFYKAYSQQFSIYIKSLIYLSFVAFIIIAFSDIFTFVWENFQIIRRFTGQTTFKEARIQQIVVTWENFIDSPFYGVGYYNAAKIGSFSLSRSNFSYTQILASYGIIYFIIYLVFLLKLFAFKYMNLKSPISLLLYISSFVAMMFYNLYLIFPIAIICYLSHSVISKSYDYKNNINYENTVH